MIAYDTQYNEVIDNNKKCVGWKNIEYNDNSWNFAPVKADDDHVLIAQISSNLEFEERYPLITNKLDNGYLLDFGTELTGLLLMDAVGARNNEISIRYGEEIETPFQVRYNLRCNCLYEDKLILAEGQNELETFEYKCFRYVQLITDDAVKMEHFRVQCRHYPYNKSYCDIVWKDELVNSIWTICKNAVVNCAQEGF